MDARVVLIREGHGVVGGEARGTCRRDVVVLKEVIKPYPSYTFASVSARAR